MNTFYLDRQTLETMRKATGTRQISYILSVLNIYKSALDQSSFVRRGKRNRKCLHRIFTSDVYIERNAIACNGTLQVRSYSG